MLRLYWQLVPSCAYRDVLRRRGRRRERRRRRRRRRRRKKEVSTQAQHLSQTTLTRGLFPYVFKLQIQALQAQYEPYEKVLHMLYVTVWRSLAAYWLEAIIITTCRHFIWSCTCRVCRTSCSSLETFVMSPTHGSQRHAARPTLPEEYCYGLKDCLKISLKEDEFWPAPTIITSGSAAVLVTKTERLAFPDLNGITLCDLNPNLCTEWPTQGTFALVSTPFCDRSIEHMCWTQCMCIFHHFQCNYSLSRCGKKPNWLSDWLTH